MLLFLGICCINHLQAGFELGIQIALCLTGKMAHHLAGVNPISGPIQGNQTTVKLQLFTTGPYVLHCGDHVLLRSGFCSGFVPDANRPMSIDQAATRAQSQQLGGCPFDGFHG